MRRHLNTTAYLFFTPLFVLFFSLHSNASELPDCAIPANIQDGWSITAATPDKRNKLCQVLNSIAGDGSNTHGVVIAQHGKLLAELYLSGRDHPHDAWIATEQQFGPTVRHDMRSVGKSITGLLFGIAQAKIGALTTPVLDYFPEYQGLRNTEKNQIQLRHLLTMSTGLQWRESGGRLVNQETQMNWAWDRYHYILSAKMVAPPGTQFNYNSGANALLAEIIHKRTGGEYESYARQMLFAPLGIQDVEWDRDFHGIVMSFAGLRMRPRDLAKVGQLMLNRGVWQGKQLVPAAWIEASTKQQIIAEDGMGYGYQWWTGSTMWQGKALPWFGALGLGGQALYVVPALDLAVVITAGRYSSANAGEPSYRLFQRIVEPLNASPINNKTD